MVAGLAKGVFEFQTSACRALRCQAALHFDEHAVGCGLGFIPQLKSMLTGCISSPGDGDGDADEMIG
jgi:hypothetical protein